MLCIRVDSFPEVQSEKRKFEPPHPLLAEIDGLYDSLGKPTCVDLKEFLISKDEGFLVQELEQKKARSGDNKGNIWTVKHAATYEAAGLAWPPSSEELEPGLPRREADILYFMEKTVKDADAEQCFNLKMS